MEICTFTFALNLILKSICILPVVCNISFTVLCLHRMAEAVKVIVRCRPLNEREKNLKCEVVVRMDGSKGSCEISKPKSKDPPKAFTFDGAYFVDSTTETIYNDIGYPLVDVRLFFVVFYAVLNFACLKNHVC